MTRTLTPRQPRSLLRPLFGRSLLSRPWLGELFDQYLPAEDDGQFAEMMGTAMDVAETDQAFEIKLDLPGVASDEIEIQIDNNTLTVRGERSEEKEETDEAKRFHRIERASGSFSRSVVLPMAVNEDETAAEFKDGVLTIIAPKTEGVRPRRIAIKS